MTVNITITTQTVLRVIGVIIAAFLGVMALYYTRTSLTLIAISFFLALALNPPVSFLSARLPGNSRGIATAISYFVVIGVIGLIFYASVPPLVNQTNDFIQELPELIEEIKNGDPDEFIPGLVDRFDLEERLSEIQNNVSGESLTSAGGPVIGFLQRLSSSLISVLTVLVLTFFMLVEGPKWVDKIWKLHPKKNRARRQQLADKMYRVVTGYVSGQLLVAFIAAISSLVMMSVLFMFGIRIPYIIPLSAIVGVFGLIPLIGATLASVIVVAVSLFESVGAAVIMAIFFVVYQQIENNAIQPIIQSKTVDLSPLTIFIAAIVGVNLAGILGAILAIPVAASLRILIKDYLHRHHIGEQATKSAKPASN